MVRVITPFMFGGRIWLPDETLEVPESERMFLGTVLEEVQAPPVPETETKPPRKPPRKPPTPEAA